jgi:hypothetical protein
MNNQNVKDEVINFITTQLKKDSEGAIENKKISLLAKWMPSINTSSKQKVALAYKFAKALGVSAKEYRKALSALREKIGVLEQKLSAGKFGDINYEAVPSKASLIYRKAFNKRDGERYRAYLGAVEKGEKKINASVVYPYEIIRPIETVYGNIDPTEARTLDAQWKNQPDWLKDNPHKGIAVVDTSGSMSGNPILVSVSLGIYFAERNTGPFKDAFITFSTSPSLQFIKGQTIAEKVRGLSRDGWNMSTNIQAVFDLILSTAVKNKISQSDMVDSVYIISDMQFNAAGGNSFTNHEVIKQKYANVGYKMPKLVYWNVNSTNTDSPVTINEQGVCLVSGCSPSILKSVLSAKQFTPIDIMMETLNNSRYDVIVV